jgi:hypothetical protein
MLTQIFFFAWTSKVTAMLIRQPSRQMKLNVDHVHSTHHLIFSSTLILWIPARKLRKILCATLDQSYYQTVEKRVGFFSFKIQFHQSERHDCDWRSKLQGTVQNASCSVDFSGAERSHCVLDASPFGLCNFVYFSCFVQGFFHLSES